MEIKIDEAIAARLDEAIDDCVNLAGDLAGQYFQEAFTKKAFDGNPWPDNKDPRRRGSELIDTGNLRRSMQVERKGNTVTISCGNQKVDYAQVHNEGFDGEVTVSAHKRVIKLKPTKKDISEEGEKKDDSNANIIRDVKEHTRRMRIPQRQFLGDAKELEQLLHDELEAYVNEQLNK